MRLGAPRNLYHRADLDLDILEALMTSFPQSEYIVSDLLLGRWYQIEILSDAGCAPYICKHSLRSLHQAACERGVCAPVTVKLVVCDQVSTDGMWLRADAQACKAVADVK